MFMVVSVNFIAVKINLILVALMQNLIFFL